MPRSTTRAAAAIDFVRRRLDMVEHQIAARGVRSELVLEAMRKVPREAFLPPCEDDCERLRFHSNGDQTFPI